MRQSPKQSSFIPITESFDLNARPIGYVDISDNEVLIKLNDKAGVTIDEIKTGKKFFGLSYVISKEKNGVVTELSLASMALMTSDSVNKS